jgi:hypothetical protein
MQSPSPSEWPRWLSRHEAGDYLKQVHGIRARYSSLANLAVYGGGPKFARQGDKPHGRVIYDRNDLDDWANEKKSATVSTTSELREAAA